MGYQPGAKEGEGRIDLTAIGRNIDRLRVANGISMDHLGRAIGYTQTAVCRWANGQAVPHLDALYRIAKYFGVTIDSLFDGVEGEG